MKKILFIIGSLRKESFNRQLALEAEKIIGSQAEVTYLDYSDVPLINQDIEFPEPEAVSRLRATVKEADGIWVFTPEYNFSYPGHVKNLFDWLSRPLVAGDYETPTIINGKKADSDQKVEVAIEERHKKKSKAGGILWLLFGFSILMGWLMPLIKEPEMMTKEPLSLMFMIFVSLVSISIGIYHLR